MSHSIAICHAKEDRAAVETLCRHFAPLVRSCQISLWHPGMSDGGAVHGEEHLTQIEKASVILLLVSTDLVADHYQEVVHALAQRQRGARVVPVLLRATPLEGLPFANLRMLPDGAAISAWRDRDEAWVQVVQGVRKVIDNLASQPPPVAPVIPVTPVPPPSPPPMPSQPTKGGSRITILFLGANPSPSVRGDLGREMSELDRRIREGSHRDRFDLKDAWAVTPNQLIQTLLRHKPSILHFGGCTADAAEGRRELLLENESGQPAPVRDEALASLFRVLATRGIRCVVLSAAFSRTQAEAISRHIDCVIGIPAAVTPEAWTVRRAWSRRRPMTRSGLRGSRPPRTGASRAPRRSWPNTRRASSGIRNIAVSSRCSVRSTASYAAICRARCAASTSPTSGFAASVNPICCTTRPASVPSCCTRRGDWRRRRACS